MTSDIINLTFINVSDDSEMDVDMSRDMTREQIVDNLVLAGFIPPLLNHNEEYGLTIRGRGELGEGQTLAQIGAQDADRVRVAVVQRGGARC